MSSRNSTPSRSSIYTLGESQVMGDSGSDSDGEDAVLQEITPALREAVRYASTRECLGLSLKSHKPANYRKLKELLHIPSPGVVADITARTMEVESKETREKIIGGYMAKKGSKFNPETLIKDRMEEFYNEDKGRDEVRPIAQAKIDQHYDTCISFSGTNKKQVESVIHKLLPLFKPESTSALEGEELVTAEIGNADKMRALKSLIEMLRAVDEMNEVSHAHKHFPKIIASYDDGKDEAELKELQDSLELHEDDLKEKDRKIARAKHANNVAMEKHHTKKRRDIVDDIEAVKAKITKVEERINRKNRLSQSRASTPSRKRSRGESDEEESPEKKLRTEKRVPIQSSPDALHELKEYFDKTNGGLTFKHTAEGFEPVDGEWTEDARKKLTFLQEEIA